MLMGTLPEGRGAVTPRPKRDGARCDWLSCCCIVPRWSAASVCAMLGGYSCGTRHSDTPAQLQLTCGARHGHICKAPCSVTC